MKGKQNSGVRFATKAIHYGYDPIAHQGAVSPPIFMTSTYAFESSAEFQAVFSGESERCVYGRQQNRTQQLLERRLAALEGGEDAIVTASGMGAIASTLLTLLKAGDEIVVHHTIYNTAGALMDEGLPKFGIKVVRADLSTEAGTRAAIGPNTRIVYFETPINPSCEVLDIARLSSAARQVGARVIVDSTFASPALQRPLEHGADLVVHSLTKYLNGHGDVLGGAIIGDAATMDAIRASGTKFLTGATPSPMSCFLILRGLKTLAIRMERHSRNALAIADWLHSHPAISKVTYPWLASFGGHDIARRQMSAGSGMISFELKAGFDGVAPMMDRLKVISRGISLGDTDSLIYHTAGMIRARQAINPDLKLSPGVTPELVRLSVGLEDSDDLIEDLGQALA
ncbi:methionine gamma-lyase [Bordetella genomosp. 10]|uniref:Methionine gamma-lyase n=1 Tax=Bordetella genomosp. 10 TaxID=1416804 RepID=A0A261RYU1_9BORD|nr:PLP-dependent aspartate aminotransferase family protein [Bordetella genomosp. 10]OZI30085.1 methionine gamma-lyase [Bordetella genomosp. 10]